MKPSSLRVVVPVVAVLLGTPLGGAAPAAADRGAVPASHVEECADEGLENARSMTRVSSTSARTSSGRHTSRAKAWVYALPGTGSRCVVVKAVGAKVRKRKGQEVDHSVGWLGSVTGTGVLDTGEVLPINDAPDNLGGAAGRTQLLAEVVELVEIETIPLEAAQFYPPSLAGLAGHEVTATLTAVGYDLYTQAWTSRSLAKPMTKAQRKKKLAAEVKVAKRRYAERMEEAAAVRDEQLALAATSSGLTAAWLTFMGETVHEQEVRFAKQSLRASKRLARHHAAEAGRGTDTREAYAHEISLAVPLG